MPSDRWVSLRFTMRSAVSWARPSWRRRRLILVRASKKLLKKRRRSLTMERSDRTLIIIGGHEDRSNNKVILGEVARRVGSGKLVVTTVAMANGTEQLFEQYEKAFRSLGVKHLYNLEIRERREATLPGKVKILDDATGVFFTGGDQIKITSQ